MSIQFLSVKKNTFDHLKGENLPTTNKSSIAKRFLISVMAAAALCGAAQAAPDNAETRYQIMVTSAKIDPNAADWQALRFAFADRPGFMVSDPDLNNTREKMFAARQSGDFKEQLTQATAIINQDYVDGEAHLYAYMAMKKLHQPDADRERATAVAILKSIQTGDGLTPETAFTVISVHEEYELLSARQIKVTDQSLKNVNGHFYDVMKTTGPDNDNATYYFLIDRVIAAEAREFER